MVKIVEVKYTSSATTTSRFNDSSERNASDTKYGKILLHIDRLCLIGSENSL